MPAQKTFLSIPTDSGTIEVVKTYDRAFAREVFKCMDDDAISSLALALGIDERPEPQTEGYLAAWQEYVDNIWHEIDEASRERDNQFSFFVVYTVADSGRQTLLFVSPDGPTAFEFANKLATK